MIGSCEIDLCPRVCVVGSGGRDEVWGLLGGAAERSTAKCHQS